MQCQLVGTFSFDVYLFNSRKCKFTFTATNVSNVVSCFQCNAYYINRSVGCIKDSRHGSDCIQSWY